MGFGYMLTRPRAYIDWAVPKDANGNDIGVCVEDVGYRHYLEWLADYLFESDIPIPESQQELLEQYREKGATYAVVDLSDCIGHSLWETECIQEMAFSGSPFAERHNEELEIWNELSEEEKGEWGDEFFTSEEDYIRLGSEYKDSQNVLKHIQHADIPYRPILSAILKEIPDTEERYKLLDFFYRNLDECASK